MKYCILLMLLIGCQTNSPKTKKEMQLYCWNWLTGQITENTTLEEIRNIKLPKECDGVVLWGELI